MKLLLALAFCFQLALPGQAQAESSALAAQGTIELAFTPWDDAEGAVIRVLQEARRAIYVQAYLLTSRFAGQGVDRGEEARRRGLRAL